VPAPPGGPQSAAKCRSGPALPWKNPNAHCEPLAHSALDPANEQHVSAHTFPEVPLAQSPERHSLPEAQDAPPIALLAGVERPSQAGSTQ
jgi:hypothetical protein